MADIESDVPSPAGDSPPGPVSEAQAVAPVTEPELVVPNQSPLPPATTARQRVKLPLRTRPAPPPSPMSRYIKLWTILTMVALLCGYILPPWITPLTVWLPCVPLYFICVSLLKQIFQLCVGILYRSPACYKEIGISQKAIVRNPRCNLIVMLPQAMLIRCAAGAAAAAGILLTMFFLGQMTYGNLDEFRPIHKVAGSVFLFLFSGAFVLWDIVTLALMVLHLFDFIEAVVDVPKTPAGQPMPGTPASRRWVLGLRRLSGTVLYGSIGWLMIYAGCVALENAMQPLWAIPGWLYAASWIATLSTLALPIAFCSLIAVVPLALLQLLLVAVCFCKFSLRGVFLVQMSTAGLVALTLSLPGSWKAIPVICLTILVVYLVFYIANQDPESSLKFTPEFVRQRIIKRRQEARLRASQRERLAPPAIWTE